MSGKFGGGIALASSLVDTSTLPNGRHLLLVQGKNDNDRWGVFSSIFITVTGSSVTPSPTNVTTDTPMPSPTDIASPTRTLTPISTSTPTSDPTTAATSTQPAITTTPTPGCAQ